ncbi:hypothetical protein [Sphingopyxis sp. PAMC25046]|nr:hypothetical protein [Sphingopyxis sp. PAMC25046]
MQRRFCKTPLYAAHIESRDLLARPREICPLSPRWVKADGAITGLVAS